MERDALLLEKDKVQENLWNQSGKTVQGYVEFIQKKSEELKKAGFKFQYTQSVHAAGEDTLV